MYTIQCLPCDAVGWAAGRASGLYTVFAIWRLPEQVVLVIEVYRGAFTARCLQCFDVVA